MKETENVFAQQMADSEIKQCKGEFYEPGENDEKKCKNNKQIGH